jgi:hypothetical protein
MFFLSFHSCVGAYHNSPKLVELVRISPIAKFGDYFYIKDADVDG